MCFWSLPAADPCRPSDPTLATAIIKMLDGSILSEPALEGGVSVLTRPTNASVETTTRCAGRP